MSRILPWMWSPTSTGPSYAIANVDGSGYQYNARFNRASAVGEFAPFSLTASANGLAALAQRAGNIDTVGGLVCWPPGGVGQKYLRYFERTRPESRFALVKLPATPYAGHGGDSVWACDSAALPDAYAASGKSALQGYSDRPVLVAALQGTTTFRVVSTGSRNWGSFAWTTTGSAYVIGSLADALDWIRVYPLGSAP